MPFGCVQKGWSSLIPDTPKPSEEPIMPPDVSWQNCTNHFDQEDTQYGIGMFIAAIVAELFAASIYCGLACEGFDRCLNNFRNKRAGGNFDW